MGYKVMGLSVMGLDLNENLMSIVNEFKIDNLVKLPNQRIVEGSKVSSIKDSRIPKLFLKKCTELYNSEKLSQYLKQDITSIYKLEVENDALNHSLYYPAYKVVDGRTIKQDTSYIEEQIRNVTINTIEEMGDAPFSYISDKLRGYMSRHMEYLNNNRKGTGELLAEALSEISRISNVIIHTRNNNMNIHFNALIIYREVLEMLAYVSSLTPADKITELEIDILNKMLDFENTELTVHQALVSVIATGSTINCLMHGVSQREANYRF